MTSTAHTDPAPAPVADARELRSALGAFPTGVTVITAPTPRGPVGMTANSFSTLSLSPPLVQFCTDHRSQLRPLFAAATSFAVNILAEDQAEIADRFARPGRDRFAATRWRPGTTGAPVISGAARVIECTVLRTIELGDHDASIGRVVTLHPDDGKPPLLFYRGEYYTL
ncbi:flavin reductase family protein [Nocardiopsis sp. RSe5-2]|uniref:Flavin reductase family protein n=1 Tax=Nocardiopsis endophytica TaxID=3018445 RepID=A0ABT4U9G7_9ACTN|nr:flavin reductase family protein [Nocardiopsis endophytica]MDA2812997.1 flavin reductase family protein [Nocardiopsis endophytica]